MLLYYHKYNYSSKYLYMWDIYHVHLKYIGAISLPKVSYVWRVSNQLLFKKDPIEKGSLIFQEGKAAAAGHVFHFHFRKDHGCFWHSTLKLASPLAHSLSLSLSDVVVSFPLLLWCYFKQCGKNRLKVPAYLDFQSNIFITKVGHSLAG